MYVYIHMAINIVNAEALLCGVDEPLLRELNVRIQLRSLWVRNNSSFISWH
jgi:hypothetical protein